MGPWRPLVEVGVPAVPALIKALKDKDSYMRQVTARALGEIGNDAAVPALNKALKDKDDDVRQAVAEALKKLKRKKQGQRI